MKLGGLNEGLTGSRGQLGKFNYLPSSPDGLGLWSGTTVAQPIRQPSLKPVFQSLPCGLVFLSSANVHCQSAALSRRLNNGENTAGEQAVGAAAGVVRFC